MTQLKTTTSKDIKLQGIKIEASQPGLVKKLGQSCEEEVIVYVVQSQKSKMIDLEKPRLAFVIHMINTPERQYFFLIM